MKTIIPVIMDKSFKRLAAIDDFSSFIWTSRYYEPGDFELVVPATAENFELFKSDYFVARDDDDNVGIVETITLQRDENGAERMIVSGRFLQSLLERRIIAEQTTVSGKLSDCVRELIADNMIAPAMAARRVPGFALDPDFDFETAFQAQYTGKNLLEVVSDICKTYKLGFRVAPKAPSFFFFSLYEGLDRTYDQQTNEWVVFSDKFDNLLTSEYVESYAEQITAVLTAGEGEGLDRKTAWTSNGETGLDRREAYNDERNIRTNEGEISEAEYIELLKESGKEKLTKITSAFSGTVYFDGIRYKKDVNLGDLCVIENSRWGLSINARLVEVIESVSETGEYSIIPTFGA